MVFLCRNVYSQFFLEGHIAGKINTKQFKVFRKKAYPDVFSRKAFLLRELTEARYQFQIQSGCLCIVAACCPISWNIPMRDSAVLDIFQMICICEQDSDRSAFLHILLKERKGKLFISHTVVESGKGIVDIKLRKLLFSFEGSVFHRALL